MAKTAKKAAKKPEPKKAVAKKPAAKAKPTMLGWFVGQVMKTTGGKANPQAVSDLLKAKLGI